MVASVIFASFYGFLMECVQYFLPYRSFSLSDEVANTSGAVVFGIIILLSKKEGLYETWRKH